MMNMDSFINLLYGKTKTLKAENSLLATKVSQLEYKLRLVSKRYEEAVNSRNSAFQAIEYHRQNLNTLDGELKYVKNELSKEQNKVTRLKQRDEYLSEQLNDIEIVNNNLRETIHMWEQQCGDSGNSGE